MTTVSYKIHCMAANNLPTPQHMSLMSPHTPPSSEETKISNIYHDSDRSQTLTMKTIYSNADIFDGDVQ